MPLTPFHLGPVLPLKVVAPRHFSIGTFAVVQVVIDLEVVWNIVSDAPVLHDRAHTLAGALLVGLACIVPSKLGLTALYRRLRPLLERRRDVPPRIVRELKDVSWVSAVTGAMLGSLTHVALDGLMHPDVRPFAPWLEETSFWVPGSFGWLHLLCGLAGLGGLLLWMRPRR
jgi:hypothetical protein